MERNKERPDRELYLERMTNGRIAGTFGSTSLPIPPFFGFGLELLLLCIKNLKNYIFFYFAILRSFYQQHQNSNIKSYTIVYTRNTYRYKL